MQSLPDARVQSILEDLRQDPYAKSILDRVNNSAFGPASISLGAESSGADNQPGRTSAEDVQEGEFAPNLFIIALDGFLMRDLL